MSRLIESTLTGKISNMLIEEDSRYYILRKLQNCFDELDSIDYGDIEGTDRYGHIEPGLEDQKRIDEKIRKLVQDNNITRAEWDSVFTDPYKSGFDLSYEDYAYNPKHASEEDKAKLKEDTKGEYTTYEVVVGWNGYIGVDYEYNIGAHSRIDAVNYAIDEPGSEAEMDFSVDDITDNGDGSYDVTISWHGDEETYTLDDDDEDDARDQALEEAKSGLEIISVDGTEFSYDEAYEGCKPKKGKKKLKEGASVDEIVSRNNAGNMYKVAKFIFDCDPNEARSNYEATDSDDDIKEKIRADILKDPKPAKKYLQDIIDDPEGNPEDWVTKSKDLLKFFEDDNIEKPTAEDLEADDKAIKEKRIKELEDKIAQINMEIGDPSLDVADVRDLSEDRVFLQAELDDLRGLVNESAKLNEEAKKLDDDEEYWIVEKVEKAMNPIFRAVDNKFNTNIGYDNYFCTELCEYIEDELESKIVDSYDEEDFNECDKSLHEDLEGRVKVSIGSQDRYYEPSDPKIEIAQKIKEKLGP